MGKILIALMHRSSSGKEVLLSILDVESFRHVYIDVLKGEDIASPLFIRRSYEELLHTIPEEVHQLRQGIFNIPQNKLSAIEREMFCDKSSFTIQDKVAWIGHFMQFKAGFLARLFCEQFEELKSKTQKIVAVCADIFHPSFWKVLAAQEKLFREPSMIYFSNAAVYSIDTNLRNEKYSTSNRYQSDLLRALPGASDGNHFFCFTERETHYYLTYSKTVPTSENLLRTFAKSEKKKNKAHG